MSILAFQMPEKVVMEKSDDFTGTFEFKPLEKGYGVTIGNALRRILLSSLEGFAITSVRTNSVLHEFSTIEGVIEDMSEIILNLKMVRFKKTSDAIADKITVRVKGQETFSGADIAKFASGFEVLNPDHVIAHLDPSTELEFELTIARGRGYVPADENKPADQVFGQIAIDAIYTPIKNVKYSIENTRVEQKTDYEKLVIEIQTDGSIHPEEALKGAANILIQHFMLFSDNTMTLEGPRVTEDEPIDEETMQMRKMLKTPLEDMELSVRAKNCLKAADIKTIGELVQLEIADMMKFRNFGKKSLTELENLVEERGLEFGMDLGKYRLEED
jgi:DNA-directed RNA polymerase subunit alpha